MTRLPYGFLAFNVPQNGEIVCDPEMVSFDLAGDGAHLVDPEVVRHAAAAVLYHFKHDLGRETVSVQEFTAALETALMGLGLVAAPPKEDAGKTPAAVAVSETDLRPLASDGIELAFFNRLRETLQNQLEPRPQLLRFVGLRDTVKLLSGARRWNGRCQALHDQVVEFLRLNLGTAPQEMPKGMVVS